MSNVCQCIHNSQCGTQVCALGVCRPCRANSECLSGQCNVNAGGVCSPRATCNTQQGSTTCLNNQICRNNECVYGTKFLTHIQVAGPSAAANNLCHSICAHHFQPSLARPTVSVFRTWSSALVACVSRSAAALAGSAPSAPVARHPDAWVRTIFCSDHTVHFYSGHTCCFMDGFCSRSEAVVWVVVICITQSMGSLKQKTVTLKWQI